MSVLDLGSKELRTIDQKDDLIRELNHLRYALDQSAIVAVTDSKGSIIHVNDRFCEISGYSREELLGKDHRIVNSSYHSKEFFSNLWRTISSGKTWSGEIRNRTKTGTYYWVNTTIVPFLDEVGKPYQYISIRYEITQRKNAENQLRIYADRLEQSNRELQDFASIAAHDLQEPLRKILAFADRLSTRFREQLPPDAKDYLDRISASAQRMRKLIDDLLSYSRITTKGREFEKTELDLILKEVLSDLEIRIEQSQAVIETENLPAIHADPLQMRQLFQNLISNAVKFSRKDTPPRITIKCTVQKNTCILSVQDQGIGFDEKYLDRIFIIFQRLHGKSEYEGTGVGLAICRRIVERHGGHITAKSLPGQGATFFVTLPLSPNQKSMTHTLNESSTAGELKT